MTKGEESRQRLIKCAAELFWKNGYSATGISQILQQTGLPKGSFYFYFKSKDELAIAVAAYYQGLLLEHFQNIAQGKKWENSHVLPAYIQASKGTAHIRYPVSLFQSADLRLSLSGSDLPHIPHHTSPQGHD